jgi:hypothetical protein
MDKPFKYNRNYYDCILRCWNIIKTFNHIGFMIDDINFKIENKKLYRFDNGQWRVLPLMSINKNKIYIFEIKLKNSLGVM